MAEHDVERAYDEIVSPLMRQVISACKEHGIPMVARFQMNDEDDALYCTTVIPQEWESAEQRQIGRLMYEGQAQVFAFTVTCPASEGAGTEGQT